MNRDSVRVAGWMFLIYSFFGEWGTCMICASIFFSAGYIIEEMNKKKL